MFDLLQELQLLYPNYKWKEKKFNNRTICSTDSIHRNYIIYIGLRNKPNKSPYYVTDIYDVVRNEYWINPKDKKIFFEIEVAIRSILKAINQRET